MNAYFGCMHLGGPPTLEAHHRECFLFSITRFTIP